MGSIAGGLEYLRVKASDCPRVASGDRKQAVRLEMSTWVTTINRTRPSFVLRDGTTIVAGSTTVNRVNPSVESVREPPGGVDDTDWLAWLAVRPGQKSAMSHTDQGAVNGNKTRRIR